MDPMVANNASEYLLYTQNNDHAVIRLTKARKKVYPRLNIPHTQPYYLRIIHSAELKSYLSYYQPVLDPNSVS